MNREGVFVPKIDEEHNSISIHILPQVVMVEGESASKDIGFSHEEALKNSQAFVEILYELSQKVDKQLLEVCPPNEPDYERIDQALHLSDDIWWSTLSDLMRIGAALRAELSQGILEKLDYHGFRFKGEEVPEEMSLTFQENKKAPILWEMLYELGNEESNSLDWHRFWGFGVPITHWMEDSRTPTIRLRSGLFSAIHEDLPFAQREEQALREWLQKGLSYYSLKQELQEHVHKFLLTKLHNEELDRWWDNYSDGLWLQHFLEEMVPNDEKRLSAIQTWKDTTLLAICKRCFTQELIHFACHCVPSKRSELLSRLIMKIAGEEFSLDVSTLVTKMRREKNYFSDPGSLVFLNACGTAHPPLTFEPPGFPDKWIRYQRALAIIATVCPVPDYFAHAFALKFYEILFASRDSSDPHIFAKDNSSNTNLFKKDDPISIRRYIANALLETRRHFMQHYNNPLGLAYILYAVKDAHVQFDPSQVNGVTKWH